eukprot:1949316-Prymnesium_polylepis.1
MKATFTTRGAEGWHPARGAQEVGGGPSIGRSMGWALAGPLRAAARCPGRRGRRRDRPWRKPSHLRWHDSSALADTVPRICVPPPPPTSAPPPPTPVPPPRAPPPRRP